MRAVDTGKIYRLFYPVVPIVVTAAHGGEVGGLAAISYIALSFKPPLIGVSIHGESRTGRLVRASKEFALNWLDYEDRDQILKISEAAGKDVRDKLKAMGLETAKAKAIAAPVLRNAVAVVECKLNNVFTTGDHELFVGESVAAYAIEDFDEYWQFSKYRAPLYIGSGRGEKFARMSIP